MRRSVWKSIPLLKKRSVSQTLSFILSMALVLLPVLPVGAAARGADPSGSGDGTATPVRAPQAATPGAALAPLSPSLSVTKTDSFPDPDGDGKAEPGQTITYTVTISNNGSSDASNVAFSDTVDPNTTLVPGSVQTQPVAANDAYNVLGNVRIQPGAAQGLLANDCDPDNGGPCSGAGLAASGPASSAQGGDVVVNADGSFTYDPPAGFEGADTFTYNVTDAAGLTDTATVTLTVGDVVWFVDHTAAAGGDGRLSSPFNSLAPLNGAGGAGDPDETDDVIFVHQGSYGGGIELETGQRLAGQGTGLDAALAGFGITAPPHSAPRPAATGRPTLTNSGGNVITLAGGNSVSHLNAAASAANSSAVFAGGVGGTTSISSVGLSAGGPANGISLVNQAGGLTTTGSTVACSSSGTAVLINGGSSAIDFKGTSVSQNGGRVVYVHNRTGGAVTFDGASAVTGTGGTLDAITLVNNSGGAVVSFAAALQLNTVAPGASGLVASGLTLNVTGSGNAISSAGGAAVDFENVAANVTFSTTFSTGSTDHGVRVQGVTGAAAFGNTTINDSAGTGVLLADNSASLSFSDLDIAPAAGRRALHATGNTGAITSASGVVSTTNATAVEIAGASAASRTPLGMTLTSVSAAASGGNPPNGIVLTNTHGPGSAVGFSVVGDGADTTAGGNASGGNISNTLGSDGATSGIGVRLENADEVSLRRMNISNHSNFAVLGLNSSNVSLEYSTVSGTNGVSGALSEGSVYFENLTGAAAITSCLIEGGLRENLNVVNTSGTLNRLTIAGSTFGFNSAGGNSSVVIESRNPGTTLNFTLRDSTVRGARLDWINATANSGSAMDAVVSGNTFDNLGANAHPAAAPGGNRVVTGSLGAQTIDIRNNTLRGSKGEAIRVRGTGAAGLTGTVNGRVRNNVIGLPNAANSGSSEGSGIFVFGDGGSKMNVAVTDNQVFQYNNHGISLTFGDEINDGSVFNLTVTGNTVNTPGTVNSDFNAIHLNNGTVGATDNFTTCADIGGAGALRNNVAGGGKGSISPNNNGIRLRQRQATTVRLPGYGGAANDNAAVAAYLLGRNNAGTANAANTVPTGGGYVGGPACVQPSFASLAQPGEVDARQHLADAGEAAPRSARNGSAGAPDFSAWQPSLHKIGRGLAYSERMRALRLDASGSETQPEGTRSAAAPAPLAAVSGGTVNVQIGTLRAGDSVTITFQVKVADPFAGAQPQVSNQGTVTANGGVSVLSDDPDAPGAADPTVTQLLLPPAIEVNDGTVAEPATGTANALFTVALSHPYTHPVTVSFTTADGTAIAGDDYTTTGGAVTFDAGQIVQTISVPVPADAIAGEGDETFFVNLSGASGGVIGDGQAIGTIRDPSVPSPVVISELRTSGPAGSGDDFVELLNTTDQDITVASSDGSGGWAIVAGGSDCSQTPVVVGVVPNGAVIPARGNYLLKGSAYSLGAYAAGDADLTADIEDDRNVGLFTTAELSNISSATLYDAVGFGANEGNNCDLLREGTNLPAAAGSTSEHSFVRKVSKGLTVDTGDNSADFVLVSTTPSVPVGVGAPTLGAPGPEGSINPRGPVPCSAPTGSAKFGREPVSQVGGVGDGPNFVRDTTPDAQNNSTLGTLDFRRTFTNNTGAPVTALRFRVVDLSTFPAGAGAADLRARTSSTITVQTGSGNKLVRGTALEAPPAQANGGGVNSTLAAGTITTATALAAGASISLRFLFGVEQAGDYDIAIVLESSPASGKDFWRLTGHTEDGGHTDRGCNRPPVANAGPDQTAECSSGEASVTLDGSASSDPDGDTPLTYEWSEGGSPLGTGQTLAVTLPLGSHAVTLKVTDPSGDSSQDTVNVNVVDTTRPVVTAPPAVTVYTGPGADSCGTTVADEALGTASAADACEGPGLTVDRAGVPAGNFFPVGTTVITYSATDAAGNTGTATQTVTVVDNTAPAVTPPADASAPNDPDSCSAVVNPGEATATDNCAVQSVVGTRSDNQALDAPYPVGTTTITWTATDVNGNTATATQTVTVKDTQAPAVNSSVAVTTMGPPHNHAPINVGLAATATDNCPGLGPVQVSVYSDEDDGAPHEPDAFDIGLGTLKLRRERDGYGNGRVYLVVVKATDAAGNAAASCRTVTVPLSTSAAHVSAVNAQAAAAASFCSANNGAAPSGFFPVGP